MLKTQKIQFKKLIQTAALVLTVLMLLMPTAVDASNFRPIIPVMPEDSDLQLMYYYDADCNLYISIQNISGEIVTISGQIWTIEHDGTSEVMFAPGREYDLGNNQLLRRGPISAEIAARIAMISLDGGENFVELQPCDCDPGREPNPDDREPSEDGPGGPISR